jgi:CPA2 family monovalent cation:H+ antiporter-2
LHDATLLLELGAILVGLAVLARLAGVIGMPTIPLYLSAGLMFGRGGLVPLVTAEEFIGIGAEIGLILLLFMLGLEYTAEELIGTIRSQTRSGALDIVLNFAPGFAVGLVLGLGVTGGMVLGGVTYVSSSGIVAKVLGDLGRIGNRETPAILALLVTEDLVMALYLPLLGAVLVGTGGMDAVGPAAIAIVVVVGVLAIARKVEVGISRLVFSRSDETLLLTVLGLTLFVAGAAEKVHISAAVAALLAGMILSGPAAEGAQAVLTPLRDLFSAMFFAFVGLSVDPSAIPPVLIPAIGLAAVGVLTKVATGWYAARAMGAGPRGRFRAGFTLVARGEFSLAIAGLATAAGVDKDLEALAVTYVFLLAIGGPLLLRIADPIIDRYGASPPPRGPVHERPAKSERRHR